MLEREASVPKERARETVNPDLFTSGLSLKVTADTVFIVSGWWKIPRLKVSRVGALKVGIHATYQWYAGKQLV